MEVLVVVVVSTVAMFGLAVPLVADRSFHNRGKRQTEAQRDAQMALRAIARAGREAKSIASGSPPGEVKFIYPLPPGGSTCFQGGPGFVDQLIQSDDCEFTNPIILIDGVRSKVDNLQFTEIVANKLVRIHIEVTHQLRTSDTQMEREVLETELFLRNGS